jgi:hypothetical protein
MGYNLSIYMYHCVLNLFPSYLLFLKNSILKQILKMQHSVCLISEIKISCVRYFKSLQYKRGILEHELPVADVNALTYHIF